ncbi:MAG: hypothetical protein QG663_317 [Thermodesulfobacteriota bacterium]|nr:hypothetical protein [Thermodesulfobacteriota bacterium]
MKSLVSVRKYSEYELGGLKEIVNNCMDDLGGLKSMINRSDKVLLKPNLLRSSNPGQAIVTHPTFVEAIAELLVDHGAQLSLGDSPPLGNLARVLSKSGYDNFMKRLNVKPCPFTRKRSLDCLNSRLFRRLELAEEVFEFDKVVNLPKIKTHCQMGLTLAVKNLFGTVIGMDKASWHLRAGKNIDSFATVLVQIYEQISPVVSIVDGVLGMEGNGPNSGKSRRIGIVVAGQDAVALDSVIASLLDFPIDLVKTCVVGSDLGLGVADPAKIAVVGDELGGFPITDFERPKSMTMSWNLSYWNPFRRFLENHVITKPAIDASICKSCGICMNHCPPGAIKSKNGMMKIDTRVCISCFCCHELCDNDAVMIVEPYLGKLLSKVSR